MRKTQLGRSQAQERRTAKTHGGSTNSGSGNGWMRKGDVRTKVTLIENKRTDAKQITLKVDDLEKIWVEAVSEGRRPLLQFDLGGRRWVVQDEDDYLEDHGSRIALADQTTLDG